VTNIIKQIALKWYYKPDYMKSDLQMSFSFEHYVNYLSICKIDK